MDYDYWPQVLQVIPTLEYKVYIYFDDGTIRLYDASELIKKGAFKQLQNDNLFISTCTVLNGTLAWTPDKSYSESTCFDLDPQYLYDNCEIVDEPIELFVSAK
ncbi:MAG: DUF2442 domain-containing protein [Defluviitaleaceae bacterium]|nr:DUF2442 domain-containing protein [Defluviitaleaceae bacterium]